MAIKNSVDKILNNISPPSPEPITIEEGMLLSVNTLVSNSIKIPEGDYVVWAVDANTDMCTLMPTAEDRFNTVEVTRPHLQGFFNPELHKRVVDNSSSIINEHDN
jgi:hypothetical protein